MGEKKTITDFIPPRRAPAEKRPSLTIVTEHDFGRQYYLDKAEITIGRDDDCDIRLQDGRTSR